MVLRYLGPGFRMRRDVLGYLPLDCSSNSWYMSSKMVLPCLCNCSQELQRDCCLSFLLVNRGQMITVMSPLTQKSLILWNRNWVKKCIMHYWRHCKYPVLAMCPGSLWEHLLQQPSLHSFRLWFQVSLHSLLWTSP